MFDLPHCALAMPEMFMLGMASLVLMVEVFAGRAAPRITYYLSQITLMGAFLLSLRQFGIAPEVTFEGSFILDNLATLLKLFIYVVGFGAFLYAREYNQYKAVASGEFYVLGLFSILGMMVLVSAASLLTLYLGLELLSLPLYALVAIQRDSKITPEAAMKYFVTGALASGMLLFGISLLYGVSKSLIISEVSHVLLSTPIVDQPILILALVLVVVGFAFKLGAVPFHMWIPDIYEGAPTSVVMLISAASKIAAFGMAVRLLVDILPMLQIKWQPILLGLAVLSLAIGNLVALAQTNLKRLFAYSAIAQVGFVLLGLYCGAVQGYGAALFYMATYALTALAGFAVLALLSQTDFEFEHIHDLAGLNARNPWLAFLMMLLLLSLAGVPPLVGFYAKLAIIQALIQVQATWLAVVAVLFSVVGLFYYLKVVKVMYFDDTTTVEPLPKFAWDARLVLSINALSMLGLGLFPSALLLLCQRVF